MYELSTACLNKKYFNMPDTILLVDKSILKIRYLFYITGINITINNKRMNKYRCWCLYVFNFLWLNTDIAGSILWFLKGVTQHKKFTELTYVTPCTIISCLSDVKTIFIILNEGTFDLLIENIRELEKKQLAREQEDDIDKIIRTEDAYLNKVMKILHIFYISLVISFAGCPCLLMLVHYYMNNKLELALPFLILYPFDPFDTRYYFWVYLHQIWSEIVVHSGIFAADCMFYIFCSYLRMQFHLLSHYIVNLIPLEAKPTYEKDEFALKTDEIIRLKSASEIRTELLNLIRWHQQIISSVDLLEILYTKSTLFNFVTSSVLICLTGFNLMAMADYAFLPTFLSFLSISLLQIFFQCLFGDLLMKASMEVGDAIYNSRWYSADEGLRKTLFLVLIRAQTPCKLTAFKFSDVNLTSFMKMVALLLMNCIIFASSISTTAATQLHNIYYSAQVCAQTQILSTSWSYFALIRTMYD